MTGSGLRLVEVQVTSDLGSGAGDLCADSSRGGQLLRGQLTVHADHRQWQPPVQHAFPSVCLQRVEVSPLDGLKNEKHTELKS